MRRLCPAAIRATDMFGLLVIGVGRQGIVAESGRSRANVRFSDVSLDARLRATLPRSAPRGAPFSSSAGRMVMGIALLAIASGIEISTPVGQIDAEIVMPKVLGKYLGPGVLGLVIAGLLAAFMSTFAATVNAGASYLVRDLWQPLIPSRRQ